MHPFDFLYQVAGGLYDVPGRHNRPARKTEPMPDLSSLPDAAKRALAEAESRRVAESGRNLPREFGGRDGPEPVRYGDWERKGIAVDF